MAQQTENQMQNLANTILGQMISFQTQLNSTYSRFIQELQNQDAIMDSVNADEDTKRYARQSIVNTYSGQLTKLLSTGYELINEIRKIFTGQEIIYRIGFISKVRGKQILKEYNIPVSMILEKAVFSLAHKGSMDNLVKLRIKKPTNRELQERGIQAVNTGSTVWSAIQHFIQDAPESFKGQKVNMGNAYEAYLSYVKQTGANAIPPASFDPDTFLDILEETKRNTVAWTQGGDIDDMQVKFFSSSPSLTTIATVRDTIKDLVEILQMYVNTSNTTTMFNALKDLFYTEEDKEKIENITEEEINNNVKDFLTTLQKNLTK